MSTYYADFNLVTILMCYRWTSQFPDDNNLYGMEFAGFGDGGLSVWLTL